MTGILKGLWKTAQSMLILFMATLLACNLYFIIMERWGGAEDPDIFGYSAAVIVSGSMEPSLSVDDLILNRAQSSYGAGDIITFRRGSSLITHRIVEVTEAGYITKGDANNTADLDAVAAEEVVGRVVGRLPYVGKVLALLKTPPGMILLVFTGFLIAELPFLLRRRKDAQGRGGDQ